MTRAVNNRVITPERTETPLVINGDMAVAQRSTSVTGITSSGYNTVDRMSISLSGLGTWTQTQDATVPTAKGFVKSLKMDVTTADASPAVGDFCAIQYKIEAQDLQLLKYGTSSAEAFTLRFHVRSPKTGTHIVHVYQNDGTRHISKAYTISSADTYQEVIINIEGDTGGTINNDNGIGLQIEFFLGAGTNFTSGTLDTSWAGYTQANSAVGQVNCADDTANNFFITGLQMEVGDFNASTMPEFQFEDAGTSLARCQRYCYQEDNSDSYHGQLLGFYSSTTLFIGILSLPVAMRSSPSITTSGNFQTAGGGSGSLDLSSIVLSDSTGTNLNQVQIRGTVSGGTQGDAAYFRNKNDTDAVFRLESEL